MAQSRRPGHTRPLSEVGSVPAGVPAAPAVSISAGPIARDLLGMTRTDLEVWRQVIRRGGFPPSALYHAMLADRLDYDIIKRLGETAELSPPNSKAVAHSILTATLSFGIDPGTAFTPWQRAGRRHVVAR